jgi:hypothetical protein
MSDKKMRVFFLRAFLPFFAIFCVLIPKSSFAFAPSPFGGFGVPTAGQVATATAGASVPGAVDLFAAAGLVAVGAYMGYMAVDYAVGGQNYTARIPLTSAAPVPAPSAPSTATGVSTYLYSATFSGISGQGSSSAAACGALGAYLAPYYTVGGCPETGTITLTYVPTGATAYGTMTKSGPTGSTCPTGYTSSSGTCVLTDARQATPDYACDFSRTGSALAMISEPDCAASGQAVPAICAADGTTCVGWGTGPDGTTPRSYVITPNGPGGSTVTTYTQSVAGATTVVTQTTVTVNPDGTVASVGGSQQTGSIPNPNPSSGSTASAAPSGTPATVTPTAGTSVTPTGTSTAPGGGTITFPSDYARQGEAKTAADSINTQLQKTETDLLAPSSAPVDASPVVQTDFTDVHFLGTFTSLLAWTPNLAGVCPTHDFSISYFGSTWTFSLNSHCQILEDNRAIMSALMVAGFTIAALFIVLGA